MPTPVLDAAREARRDQIYGIAHGYAQKTYTTLTPGQHKAIAEAITAQELSYDGVLNPSEGLIAGTADLIRDTRRDLFRSPPSVESVTQLLLAQRGPQISGQEMLTLSRRVAQMTADELLDATEGVDLNKLAKPVTREMSPAERSRVNGISPEDMMLIARGHDVHNLDPAKRIEYRAHVVAETAPMATPAIQEAKAKIAAGTPWSKLSPQMQVRVGHELKVAKLTLAEAGIDTSDPDGEDE